MPILLLIPCSKPVVPTIQPPTEPPFLPHFYPSFDLLSPLFYPISTHPLPSPLCYTPAGRKLLGSLTDAYSSMIFGSGIIHGDPHPGNIFILRGSGDVCLLDCGQVCPLCGPYLALICPYLPLFAPI